MKTIVSHHNRQRRRRRTHQEYQHPSNRHQTGTLFTALPTPPPPLYCCCSLPPSLADVMKPYPVMAKTIRRSESGRERVAHTNNQTDQGKTFQIIDRVLPMFQILRYRRFCAVATTTDDCLSLYLTMLLSINSKRPMLPSREYGDDEPTNYSTINPDGYKFS